jgi:hypothetical protein
METEADVDCKIAKRSRQDAMRKITYCKIPLALIALVAILLAAGYVLHFLVVFKRTRAVLLNQQADNDVFVAICKSANLNIDTLAGMDAAATQRFRLACMQRTDSLQMDVNYESLLVALDDFVGHLIPPGVPCNDLCRRFLEDVVKYAGIILLSMLVLACLTCFYCVRPYCETRRLLVERIAQVKAEEGCRAYTDSMNLLAKQAVMQLQAASAHRREITFEEDTTEAEDSGIGLSVNTSHV